MTKPSSKFIIVTEKPKAFSNIADCRVVTPQEFLIHSRDNLSLKKQTRIINLSNNYEYLSRGYYVSLLAEARGAQCIPNVANIIALNWRRNYTHAFPELNALLEKHYDLPFEEPLIRTFTSFFGRHQNAKIEPLARRIFDKFRLPIVSFEIKYTDKGKWNLNAIEAGSFNNLLDQQLQIFYDDLAKFTGSAWKQARGNTQQERYWLAILHNPSEKNAPSNPAALKKFIEVGKKMNIWVELITKDDFSSLLEFDALFIRETTSIENHTYRFAQKAELEGIPSIEDTSSIIRCCNKVYLNELLETHKIDKPATLVLDRKSLESKISSIAFPAVLKIPDGAFSLGVFKVNDENELRQQALSLLNKSDIILCQEFTPSIFDWRIGVLNNKPLFANKYYMAAGHWQIYNHAAKKVKQKTGADEAVPLEDVPANVLKAALKVTALIGDGLYGVDLKQLEDGRVVVIEVNDNPNIDHGVEDKILGDALYKTILQHIIDKIED